MIQAKIPLINRVEEEGGRERGEEKGRDGERQGRKERGREKRREERREGRRERPGETDSGCLDDAIQHNPGHRLDSSPPKKSTATINPFQEHTVPKERAFSTLSSGHMSRFMQSGKHTHRATRYEKRRIYIGTRNNKTMAPSSPPPPPSL